MRGKGSRIALAAGAGALALASCTSASSSSSAVNETASAPCAWPSVVGIHTFNEGLPDPEGTYWFEPIVAATSTRITVSGTFPDARYFSLTVYTPSGVSTDLADYQIAPEPGSVNPWRQQAAPGGRYEVTIGAGGQANTLSYPSGTSAAHPGYLVYRVYIPAGGTLSRLTPPTITLTQGRTSRTLSACLTSSPVQPPERAPGNQATAGTAPPPPGAFFGPSESFYRLGLADANTSYLEAYIVRPPAADVVVVTAKAPTFTPGSSPLPWPRAGTDMRYWSMCVGVGIASVPTVVNTLPDGRTDYGCRDDYQTRLTGGYYAYVIGSQTQEAAISRVPGVTFLPFSTAQATRLYLLILRNKLISPGFARSAQSVTQAVDPSAASAAMGPYYPRVYTCALSTLIAKGLSACEATTQRAP